VILNSFPSIKQITLQRELKVLPQNNLLIIRAFRKAVRVLTEFKALFFIFMSDGAQVALHDLQKRIALRSQNWSMYRIYLSAKLGLLSLSDGRGLNKVFTKLGCHHIDQITIEIIQKNKEDCTEALRNLSAAKLLDLYQYFRYFGDFRIAHYLREQTLKSFIKQQKEMKTVAPIGLQACLEIGKSDLVLELVEQKKVRDTDRKCIDEIMAMAYALLGQISDANQIWRQIFRSCDELFLKLIEGRSIALVGPAPLLEEGGAEIDSFDIVARTNYRTGSNTPFEIFGKRTDVSYYNHYRMSASAGNVDDVLSVADELRWVILKSQADEMRFRGLLPTCADKARTSYVADSVFFDDSAPMGIQNILSDLIRFSPKCIKLFNTTFFNSDITYGQNYRMTPVDDKFLSESIRIHEPFSGFVFVKNLNLSGLCIADHLTEKVLGLSCEQYAENLNRLYGEYTLPGHFA